VGRYEVAFTSDDRSARVAVAVQGADDIPSDSVFGSLAEASGFFQEGSLGYSATRDPALCDGIDLQCTSWSITPAVVEHAESTFFEDEERFPNGAGSWTPRWSCATSRRPGRRGRR
jgi:hypothetical protein